MNTVAPTPAAERPSLRFGRGLLPVVVLLVVTSVWFVIVPLVIYPLVDSMVTALLAQAAGFAVLIAIAWAVLRWEGLRPRDVGFGPGDVLPGVLPVVGIYALVSAIAAVAVLVAGDPVRFATAEPLAYWVGMGLVQVLFVGIAEELAYRAYLQNKLIALFGGAHDRSRKAAAILVGAVLFTLLHLPQRVLIGGLTDPVAIAQTLVAVIILGALLGVLYEYTRNVVLVGVLHGTFNFDSVVVADAPGNLALLLTIPVFVVVLWQYRRWAAQTRPATFGAQTLTGDGDVAAA